MDSSSPSKRRKTSPTSAVGINASNAPSLTPGYNVEPTTVSRASYLSPTKAGLSRFNPGLLPRAQSAANGATKRATRSSRDPTVGRPKSARGEGNLPNALDRLLKRTTPGPHQEDVQEKSPTNGTGPVTPRRTAQALGGGMSVAPRRLSRTPGRAASAGPTSTGGADAVIAASPPETAEETPDVAQGVIDGQLEQELQGSAGNSSTRNSRARDRIEVPASADQGEPELPPTPTQLGLEAPPEPPKGLLYSPSRRPPRKKSSGVKSSPLKPRDPPDEMPPKTQKRTSARIQEMMKQTERQPEAKVEEISEEVLHKQRRRDELRVHLQRLQEDVEVCEEEIERVRKPGVPPAPNEETLRQLTFILANEGADPPKPPIPPPPPLSKILCDFLPFSRPITVNISRPTPSILPDIPLPSHLPIDFEDPLPYLKVFTPLDFTSTSIILSTSDDSHDLLQRHEISITAPQRLLGLKLDLTVKTSTNTAHDLVIQSLSTWAEVELGSWIRERATGDGPEGKDISSICWATSRYWELSEKRARRWAQCYAEFPALLGGEALSEGEARDVGQAKAVSTGRPNKRQKISQGRDPEDRPSNSLEDDDDDDDNAPDPAPLPRHVIAQHLGRQSLLFQHPTSKTLSLLITWRIEFDWTGEAESHLQAVSAVPESWKDADERGSLGKVGSVFEDLVERLGVLGAVRGVVGLLFKDV